MTDAEYYQNHKDDEHEWGDPIPKPFELSPRIGFSEQITNLAIQELHKQGAWTFRSWFVIENGSSLQSLIGGSKDKTNTIIHDIPPPTPVSTGIEWETLPTPSFLIPSSGGTLIVTICRDNKNIGCIYNGYVSPGLNWRNKKKKNESVTVNFDCPYKLEFSGDAVVGSDNLDQMLHKYNKLKDIEAQLNKI